MRTLDLHFHPSYKPIFSTKYTPWDNIPAKDVLLGEIIRSQGSLTYVIDNQEYNLLCISLYPPETAFVSQWLVQLIVPHITDGLDKTILDTMINQTLSYQDEIAKEISNLKPSPQIKPLRFLKSFSEYDRTDFSTLYILFNIEGGHAFYGKSKNDCNNINQILTDLSAFMQKKEILVFYITPCHLTPNIFLNHAYGNKLLGKGEFIPRGYGITQGCGSPFLDKITDEGLLIDVKHMSVISRQGFYKNPYWNQKPLLSSHTGVTGISWFHKLDSNTTMLSLKKGPGFIKVRYRKPHGIVPGTYFNPISMNLYDEDILKILQSEGLIGISMDLRIIGGERNIFNELKLIEKEFVSEAEFGEWKEQNSFVGHMKKSDYDKPYDDYDWVDNQINSLIWDEEDRRDEFEELNTLLEDEIREIYKKGFDDKVPQLVFPETRFEEHLAYFVNQLFHIVITAQKACLHIDPWKHICIGSDFDGYIRTIDCCRTASGLSQFAVTLIDRLQGFANDANICLPRKAEKLVEDIFFNNCFNIMEQHFKQNAFNNTL